jgi:adenylate cyclase
MTSSHSGGTPGSARLSGGTAGAPPGEWKIAPGAVIGRAPGNVIVLPDPKVSKEHAVLSSDQQGWMIRDLGSVNGTYVNGQKIAVVSRLRHGDEIGMGSSRLVFLQEEVTAESSGALGHHSLGVEKKMPTIFAAASFSAEEERNFNPVDQIRDLETLKRDYEKLRIAHEFHRALGGLRDPNLVSQKILEVAFAMLPADSGAVLLRDPRQSGLRAAAVHVPSVDSRLMLSETLLAHVMQTRQGVVTSDAMTDSRFNNAQSIMLLGVRSAMAVPLLGANNDVRGVIFLDSRSRAYAFSEKDLRLLTTIGAQAGTALENAEMAESRAQIARYLPPPLVEQFARGAITMERGGTLVEGSILFLDIRGFTSLAEKQTATETVEMLNIFFEAMVEEVFANGGMLDKYLGDGLMALFGMPVRQPDSGASAALRAALGMIRRMEPMNEDRRKIGQGALAIGVGVNTGTVIVGSMGSERRMEYTAIGDAVNLASRLCGLAEGGDVICSYDTMARAQGFSFNALPPTPVKGKREPIRIYKAKLGVSSHTM